MQGALCYTDPLSLGSQSLTDMFLKQFLHAVAATQDYHLGNIKVIH